MSTMDEKDTGDEPTKQELYDEAKKQDVPGRSEMSKEELADAVGEVNPHDLTPGEPTPLAEWRKNEYEGGRPAED